MFNFLKKLFSSNKQEAEPYVIPTRPPPPAAPPPVGYTRANVNKSRYYRKNGGYYSTEDGSLVEDLLLLGILNELFTTPFEEEVLEPVEEVTTGDDIDYAAEQVRETYVEPTPEPSYYSSASNDSGSSYDSGGDSGGSDD